MKAMTMGNVRRKKDTEIRRSGATFNIWNDQEAAYNKEVSF